MKNLLFLSLIFLTLGCAMQRSDIVMDEHKMSINEAKTVLLDFKVQSDKNLEKALEVMYRYEEPEHYEEWGQSDGKNYFYSKDIFKKAGIIIHKNDNKITNVEKY